MAYLFAYFTGEENKGEQVYFSVSRDGLFWEDIYGNRPVIVSDKGECGIRDPFILRLEDGSGFVLIGTDLCIAGGTSWEKAVTAGSRSLLVSRSEDLIEWSEPKLIEVSVLQAGCTWAPEAIYDKKENNYIVFWASKVKLEKDEQPKHRIYYSRTTDFRSFSEPEIFIERENHVIDTTIAYEDGIYYRFSKDETTKNIRVDYSDTLEPASFKDKKVPVLDSFYGVEGPEIYYIRELKKWCLILDRFASGKGYIPLLCDSLSECSFRIADDNEYSMGKTKKRHGSVIEISDAEYDRLKTHAYNTGVR